MCRAHGVPPQGVAVDLRPHRQQHVLSAASRRHADAIALVPLDSRGVHPRDIRYGRWRADGSNEHGEAVQTPWAWRDVGANAAPNPTGLDGLFLNYSEFAVVVPLEPPGHLPPPALMKELMAMPTADPGRLRALRAGVDKVASLMRYAASECDGIDCQDAFSHFIELRRALRPSRWR